MTTQTLYGLRGFLDDDVRPWYVRDDLEEIRQLKIRAEKEFPNWKFVIIKVETVETVIE